MKRLLVLFVLVFPLICMAQLMPIQRNFFTTNPAPIVEVVAGSNATVQASLVGVNTRRFTVNSTAVGGSGQTNNTVLTQGTNTVITSSSGGGTTTYDVNAITDTNVVSIIATNVAAYESSLATNDLWGSTMALSNSVFQAGTNWAGTAKQDATNALWTATMGLSNSVFQAGTNWSGTAKADATNALWTASMSLSNSVFQAATNAAGGYKTDATNGLWSSTMSLSNSVFQAGTNWAGTAKTDATNGLWTAAKDLTNTTGLKVYATNVLSGGQLPIGTVATNSAFDGAFLTATNNGTARVWTMLGDPLTNSSGYSLASMADTNWTILQIAQAGAYEYFGGPTNSFAITNSGETVSRTNVFTCSVSPFVNASTSTVSTLVLNAYARHSISTNRFDRIAAGPVAIETYPFRTGGAGTISGHYEFYAVDCVSNIMYELGSGPVFTISATAPTLITTSFVITNGFTATNKCFAAVAFKFDAIGTGGPTVSWAHGGVYAAHLNFVRPLSSATIDGTQVLGTVTNAYNSVNATNLFNANLPTPTNSPSAGKIVSATSATSAMWDITRVPGPDYETCRQSVAIFDDLFGPYGGGTIGCGPGSLAVVANSGGFAADNTYSKFGVILLSTLSSATSAPLIGCGVSTANPVIQFSGNVCITNEWKALWVTALPSAAENYTNIIGFGNQTTGALPTSGAYFQYDTNNAKLKCVTALSSSYTFATNTTTIAQNTWYKLRIVLTTNAAVFTVNGTDAVTNTANIPTGAALNTTAQIIKGGGTTARQLALDWYYLGYDFGQIR